ncbi:MAG: alkaline phosphatase family protein [Candidatus Hydrogenedentota bacterium]
MVISLFKKKEKSRVIIIGLDGVPYTLITTLLDKGIMPNLNSICKTGRLSQMDTTIPDVSSVAWSSFITGVNPGKHNLYGFFEIHPKSYRYIFPQLSDLKSKLIWDILGKRTIAFNIPSTYPAQPINGIMVSGFVACELDKSVYPEELLMQLKKINYRTDVDSSLGKDNKNKFIEDVYNTFSIHKNLLLDLLKNEEWDLFIGVITATDRLQHFLIDAFFDEKHRYHTEFINFYKEVDKFLGEVFSEKTDDVLFGIISDHGFTRLQKEINVNRILIEKGFLKVKGKEFTDILSDTKAFCLTPGRIYIHYADKFRDGSVSRNGGFKIIDELTDIFKDLKFDDKKVIKDIYRPEVIYKGEYIVNAPDLVLVSEYGFDIKGSLNKENIFNDTHFTGMHTHDDAFLFLSEKYQKQRPHILDVTATIAGFFDKEIIKQLDGENLL